jgi:hypothetical protein
MVDRTAEQRCGTLGQSPDGTFFAAGVGGQYAFVIAAYDLVVVHRGPHPEGGLANFRTVGRLLWLILDAGKFPDIGPDASLEAAQGMQADGDGLSRMLTGKTLLHGDAVPGGPYRVRLNADGTAAVLRGKERTEFDTGTWNVREKNSAASGRRSNLVRCAWLLSAQDRRSSSSIAWA